MLLQRPAGGLLRLTLLARSPYLAGYSNDHHQTVWDHSRSNWPRNWCSMCRNHGPAKSSPSVSWLGGPPISRQRSSNPPLRRLRPKHLELAVGNGKSAMLDGVVASSCTTSATGWTIRAGIGNGGAAKRTRAGQLPELLLHYLLERHLLPSALGEQIMSLREHVNPLLD